MASASDFKVKKGLQVQGGDLNLGNAQNAVIQVDAVSGTNTAGKTLTISGGEGTGTGAGGSIIFQTADGGGTGSSVNPLATALTIADDLSSAFTGAVTLNGAVTLGNASGDDITNTGRWVGDFVPKTDSSIDLGTSALQFAEAHIDTGHIDDITSTGTSTLSTVDIGGGAIDDTTVGATTASTGAFTTLSATGATSVGVDGTGADVTFHSDTSGDNMLWDTSAKKLVITGTDMTTALEVADGNVTMADNLTVTGNSSVTGNLSITGTSALIGATSVGSATATSTVTQVASGQGIHGKSLTITGGNTTTGGVTNDRTGGDLLLQGGQGTGTGAGGSIIFKSAGAAGSTANSPLNPLDDTLLTLASTGAATFAGAVSGITTLATSGAVTIGANEAGADVQYYGDTDGLGMLWDTSTDKLVIHGRAAYDALQVTQGDVLVSQTINTNVLETDTINESTADAGVTIDSVLLNNSAVYTGSNTTDKGKLYGNATNTYLTHTATSGNINLVATGTGEVLMDNVRVGGDTVWNNTANLKLNGIATGGVNIASTAGTHATVAGTAIDVNGGSAGNFDIGLQVNPGASAGQYAEVRIKTSTESPIANSAPGSCLVLRNANTAATGTNATYYDFGTDNDGRVWGTGTLHGDPDIFTIGNFIGKSYDGAKNSSTQTPTVAANSVLEISKPTAATAVKDVLTLVNTVNATGGAGGGGHTGTGSAIAFDQWYFDSTIPARADAGRIAVKTAADWTATSTTRDATMVFGVALNNTVTDSLTLNSDGSVGFRSYTFPTAIGSSGEVLKAPSSGTLLEWASDTGGGTASDVAADDITVGNAAVEIETSTGGVDISTNAVNQALTMGNTSGATAILGSTIDLTSTGAIGITAPVFKISSGTTDRPVFTVEGTAADATAPTIELRSTAGTGSAGIGEDGNPSGFFTFSSRNDNNQDHMYGRIRTIGSAAADGSEEGTMTLAVSTTDSGTITDVITIAGGANAAGSTTTIKGNLAVEGTTTTVNQTEVNVTNAFVFEGASANDYETTLTIVEPTADRTINLPDAAGTVTVAGGTGLTLSSAGSMSVNASQTQITSVGALNAGSITSGFTSIDVGSGAISTTGTLTGGSVVAEDSITIEGGSFTDATCDYNDDPTITMDSTAAVFAGMSVSGTDIPVGATVSSVTNSTTFELSASTTGGIKTNQTLTFTNNTVFMDTYSATLTTINATTMFTLASNAYSAAKVLASVWLDDGSDNRSVTEFLFTYVGASTPAATGNIHMTEYALVDTSGSQLATFDVVKDSGNILVQITPGSTTSTKVRAQITQLAI